MSGFVNGESNASVRAKLNAALTREITTVAALVANTTLTYSTGQPGTVSAGDIITTRAEGFQYQVVGASADHDLATAGGVRLLVLPGSDGSINFRAMAPAADGVTDDFPKLRRLLDKRIPGAIRGPTIYLPLGSYFMGQTIEIKNPVTIKGDADGFYTEFTARLIFPANTHGIVINRNNTLSTGIETTPTGAGDYTVISGLNIRSLGGTDRTKHGIWMRARGKIHATQVQNFPGNGCNIVASTNTSDDTFGNANLWYLEGCGFTGNRNHGLFVDGIDANAGVANFCDFFVNGRMGCYDSSFLGNTYVGCHASSNGLRGKGGNTQAQSSVVVWENVRYAAHWTATEQQLVDTQPGTNANIWVPYQEGGVTDNYAPWLPGQPVGTYFRAFGYFSDSIVASNYFFNCYNEVDAPSVLLGGAVSMGRMMEGLLVGANVSSLPNGQLLLSSSVFRTGIYTTNLAEPSGWISLSTPTIEGTWRFQNSADFILFRNSNQSARTAWYVTGQNHPVPWRMGAPQIILGDDINGRVLDSGTAIPNNAEGRVGDLRINRNPARGGPGAWQKASDGTWQVAWTLP